jgi:hypothetical protein
MAPGKGKSVIASSTSDPDDIRVFPSLFQAAKGLKAAGHSSILSAINRKSQVNGFTVRYQETTEDPSIANREFHKSEEPDVSCFLEANTFNDIKTILLDKFTIRNEYVVDEDEHLYSIFDVIKVFSHNHLQTWSHIQLEHPEMCESFVLYKFSGQGQKPSPACDDLGLMHLLTAIPCKTCRLIQAKVVETYVKSGDPIEIRLCVNNRKIQNISLY